MTAPRTPDELARLVEQATPGPWGEFYPGQCCTDACLVRINGIGDVLHNSGVKHADAALIVALRNDAPRLIAALRVAEAEAAAKDANDAYAHCVTAPRKAKTEQDVQDFYDESRRLGKASVDARRQARAALDAYRATS